MSRIQIRFNTEKEKVSRELPAWRVLVDGKEFLAHAVRIEVPMWTSEDILATGEKKCRSGVRTVREKAALPDSR